MSKEITKEEAKSIVVEYAAAASTLTIIGIVGKPGGGK